MLELEPMKAEEYEAFLSDPSDDMMRAYLPRVFESAAPLAKLRQALSRNPLRYEAHAAA
jgi:hypothetical protein